MKAMMPGTVLLVDAAAQLVRDNRSGTEIELRSEVVDLRQSSVRAAQMICEMQPR